MAFHILNGDALKEQFPATITGEKIVFRECLVDGPVKADSLPEFYQLREHYLSQHYGAEQQPAYNSYVVSEFEKILNIPEGSEVNLWFEDDLFCQVNLWFCIHLLRNKAVKLCLVRPNQLSPYGFGAYSTEELVLLFSQRSKILSIELWNRLWNSYESQSIETLFWIAGQLVEYPFLFEAAKAHADRLVVGVTWGRPQQTLIKIMEELGTDEFGPIFQEFTKREPIYGFGDLQVHRLYQEVIESKNGKHE